MGNSVLFSEKTTLAKIWIMKHYSKYRRTKIAGVGEDALLYNGGILRYLRTRSEDKKNQDMFHTNEFETDEKYTIRRQSKILMTPYTKQPCVTTKSRSINRNFKNPMAAVTICDCYRKIIIKDDKIMIRITTIIKFRDTCQRHFTRKCYTKTFSWDNKTGHFRVITPHTIRTNDFIGLSGSIGILSQIDRHFTPISDLKESIRNDLYEKEINFEKLINKTIGFNLVLFNQNNKVLLFNRINIIERFVEKRKIKVPNDYFELIKNYYPTEKYLAKNGRKLVMSILDRHNIKSKLTNKLVHENWGDIRMLILMKWIFEDTFTQDLGKILDREFFTAINMTDYFDKQTVQDIKLGLNKEEKEIILNLINNTKNSEFPFEGKETTIIDTFRTYSEIKKYFPEFKIIKGDDSNLIQLHDTFTKLSYYIKRGTTTEYVFRDTCLNKIESEITYTYLDDDYKVKSYSFTPHILKSDAEYYEEGKFMHHCVNGYVNKESSIIISIRNQEKDERVTCEYHIQNGMLIQSKYHSNQEPPPYFSPSIERLSNIVYELSKWNQLNWREKKVVPIKINGVELDLKKIDIHEINRNSQTRIIEDIIGYLV
jgi:hypothetical protein